MLTQGCDHDHDTIGADLRGGRRGVALGHGVRQRQGRGGPGGAQVLLPLPRAPGGRPPGRRALHLALQVRTNRTGRTGGLWRAAACLSVCLSVHSWSTHQTRPTQPQVPGAGAAAGVLRLPHRGHRQAPAPPLPPPPVRPLHPLPSSATPKKAHPFFPPLPFHVRRAKLGDILYLVFLPPEARLHDDHSGDRSHMVYTNLLLASAAAQVGWAVFSYSHVHGVHAPPKKMTMDRRRWPPRYCSCMATLSTRAITTSSSTASTSPPCSSTSGRAPSTGARMIEMTPWSRGRPDWLTSLIPKHLTTHQLIPPNLPHPYALFVAQLHLPAHLGRHGQLHGLRQRPDERE